MCIYIYIYIMVIAIFVLVPVMITTIYKIICICVYYTKHYIFHTTSLTHILHMICIYIYMYLILCIIQYVLDTIHYIPRLICIRHYSAYMCSLYYALYKIHDILDII